MPIVRNNFEQLLEEEASAFDVQKHNQAKKRVIGTLDSYKLIGQLFTVFVPDMVEVLIVATRGAPSTAGEEKEQPSRHSPPPYLGEGPTDQGPNLPEDGFDSIR